MNLTLKRSAFAFSAIASLLFDGRCKRRFRLLSRRLMCVLAAFLVTTTTLLEY